MRPPAHAVLSLFLLLVIFLPARAAEPFFKKGDVIALVGGEDMVVASECGYLELLLVRALPDYRLRFRNLAWEGDTVFEQRRDLNFPTWEEQLDKIGATVVIAQFGQMESLAGKEKLPEFIAAYEKLVERFSGGGKRRVVIVPPIVLLNDQTIEASKTYAAALRKLADSSKAKFVDFEPWFIPAMHGLGLRDGIHFAGSGQQTFGAAVAVGIARKAFPNDTPFEFGLPHYGDIPIHKLSSLILAKNRLWFDYWRPQNWAFLAGDRTAQPSSRDHLDPSKRWFPPEREAFLPLIDAKEKEIDALAQELAQP